MTFLDSRDSLVFPHNVVTLVGQGETVVRVDSCTFQFLRGGTSGVHATFLLSGTPVTQAESDWEATVWPGCVEFRGQTGGESIRILHGAFAGCGYFVAVQVSGKSKVTLSEAPADLGLKVCLTEDSHRSQVTFHQGEWDTALGWDELRERSREKYVSGGLQLRSPSPRLNRAVSFSQHLLDLSFDGELMVCEIYRWKDVWARDLATGLLAGALVTGRSAMARRSLDYDLSRYAANDPVGCKNQDDTSKGGTIDGVAWTLRSLWQAYLQDGDRETLAQGFRVMEPWVEHWMKREAGGLVSDLTENFDHIYHLLAPDGVRTLGANALFALMLKTAALISSALGKEEACYAVGHARTAAAIEEHFWNEAMGAYVNLLWWGDQDLRTNQVYHSLLILAEAIPAHRAQQAFATLKQKNHTPWGSLTMMPPLTHVEPDNDQNTTIWPWWNLWEAQARYQLRDAETAWHLLEGAARTIEIPDHPGMMKEILSAEGQSIGGRAFVTGAGNLLDTVVRGLLGFEFCAPGQLRVTPQFPADWSHGSARIPTSGGWVDLTWLNGQLGVDVHDPHILSVAASEETRVSGAVHEPVAHDTPRETPRTQSPPPLAPLCKRRAKIFAEAGFPVSNILPPDGERVGREGLARLVDDTTCDALVVVGSAMPLRLPDGSLVPALLDRFIERGGSLAFFGATVNPRTDAPGKGGMAEACGLVDWYDWLPTRKPIALRDWEMTISDFLQNDPRKAEADPIRKALQSREVSLHWTPISPLEPAPYFSPTGNWVWYRAKFLLPAEHRGQPLWIDLGPVEDFEFVFVNRRFAGDYCNQRAIREHALESAKLELWDLNRNVPRLHRITPGTPAYDGLVFGGENELAIQVYRTYAAVGLVSPETATLGTDTENFAWQAADPDRPGLAFRELWRKGVAYWGGDKYFNAWETRLGASGFAIPGQGLHFAPGSPLVRFGPREGPVEEAFTDFAVFQPWRFEPLAWTETQRGILHPQIPERYPCVARLVNTETGGEILLIGHSVATRLKASEVLAGCGMELA